MATQLTSPRESLRERGRFSTQESEPEISPRSKARMYNKSGAQGEFSGLYDKNGHHLKADGTPDMRFKENKEDFGGEGFEYSSKGYDKNESSNEREFSFEPKKRIQENIEHTKSDSTPDMRYKENKEKFSGKGYEGTTSKSTSSLSKANLGIYEGNLPGEHSGKFDMQGHHLKSDGTPDMRFKENKEEFSGKGYENKEAKYKQEGKAFTNKVNYRRKRPPTPYAIYIRENAPQMKKDNPDMEMNEVFRELASQWRSSSDKDKKKYYDMYNKEVKRFQEQSLTPHRVNLYSRKLTENRGRNYLFNFGFSKKSKGLRSNKNFREEETMEDEKDNFNSYEGIVA